MVQTKSGNKAIQKPSTSNASYRTGPSTPAYSDAQRQLFDRPSSQPSISSSRYPIGRSHTMETRVGSPHQASATYQPTLPAGSSIPLRPQHRSISRNEDSRFSKPRAFAPPLPRPYTSVTSTDFQAAGKRPVSPMIQPGPSMRPSIREPESRVQFQDWASTSSLGATSTRQLSTAGSWGSSPRSSDLELPDEDREDATASFRASEGRYACEFCAKKFARPSSLRIHRNSHTGERPFDCLECPKKFSVLSNLVRGYSLCDFLE